MGEGGSSSALGSELQALRLARGISLEAMAQATRIGSSHVRALEADRFADLPAPVFVKGIIRAYCGHLAEPAEPWIDRYRQISGECPAAHVTARPAGTRRTAMTGPVWVSLALVTLLGGALVVVTHLVRPGPSPTRSIPAVSPDPAPRQPGETVAAAAMPVPPVALLPAPEGDSGSLRLTVRAVEQTWIRVQTGEGAVVQELLAPGAVREWTSGRRFLLTVGNAGGIELALNGRVMAPLGARGTVIRGLQIPPPGDPGS